MADEIRILSDEDVATLFEDSDNQEETNSNIQRITAEEAEEILQEDESVEKQKKEEPKISDISTNISSITKQLFDDISDDEVAGINDVESLKALINKSISNGIDDETKRVKEALDAGIPAADVKEFKETLDYLDSIKAEDIDDDSNEGHALRQKLILQALINEGIDEKTAVEKINAIFKSGDDKNAAEKALEDNKKFFKSAFNNLVEEGKKVQKVEEEKINKQTEELKEAIFSQTNFLKEIEIDEKTKKLALKNISEPVYKDKESGQMLTALQKYQLENKTDFLMNLALLFTLTNEFKDVDKFYEKGMKKRVNKEISNMENVLRNPPTDDDNLSMVRGKQNNRIENFAFAI